MTKIEQKIQFDSHSEVFKCYCGENSYLEFIYDKDDDQYYVNITIHPTRLLERLKLAWKALRGLEFSTSNEVIVDGPDFRRYLRTVIPNNKARYHSK